MRIVPSLVVVAALFATCPAYSAPDTVRVTLHDGLVSVEAKNAPLREILEAWARVGEVAIVNADRATTTQLTLDLVDVPEEEALAVLLRSMGGYLAVPRSGARADASHFARIVILPMSVADRDSAAQSVSPDTTLALPPAPPPATMVNGVTRLIGPNGLPVDDDQQDAPSPEAVPGPGAGVTQQAPQTSPSSPGAGGSTVPGMVVPRQPQGQPPLSPTPQR